MTTYKIIRFYRDENHPDNHKVIKTGLTKKEAHKHCSRKDTMENGVWFDGFTKEKISWLEKK